jgi:cyclic pyranopterin monophosphate synthase
MQDITHKRITLRTARAVGIIFCTPETLDIIKQNALPKGNLFDVARAAAFLGAKHTPQLLPHCHPVTIDGMDVQFEFLNVTDHAHLFSESIAAKSGIVIQGTAKSIGKTGIEMEILMGVSVAALEIYDMLKPVDKSLEIGHIRLLEKKGGKSDRQFKLDDHTRCAVLVCSDSISAGNGVDKSGLTIMNMLQPFTQQDITYQIVADDVKAIQEAVLTWVNEDVGFVFITGGTGLGPRDQTIEALRAIIEKEAVGVGEAMRAYGQQRTPLAMMSRSLAGTIKQTTVVALPGSVGGVAESLEAILPAIFHSRKMLEAQRHD